MKSKSLVLVLLLFTTVFSTSMAGYIIGSDRAKSRTLPQSTVSSEAEKTQKLPVTSAQAETENETEFVKTKYVLRETDGKIALFIRYSNGEEKLFNSYDAEVDFLPKSDRERLKEGIEMDSLSDVLQLIEDYEG